ncbi:hypothetical protein JKP88DRAFT_350205 [Tribonema minus]|uniref:Uncharacterized protein n=1 Tax=Tribonema minus TaxID=303371 RepID=A0A835YPG0_9STRA|nr:hypothetical protein JKP88DRAFT_350205 [Tribonema minus]
MATVVQLPAALERINFESSEPSCLPILLWPNSLWDLSLRHCTIWAQYHLPASLESLTLVGAVVEGEFQSGGGAVGLPEGLETLTLLDCTVEFQLHLPSTLRRVVTFGDDPMAEPGAPAHNATCNAFVHLHSPPPRLVELDLRGCGDMFVLPAFPASLEVLKLPGRYSAPIAALPASLQQLWLGGRFNSALGPLPRQLRQLHVVAYEGKTSFNKRLAALPDSLQELLLGTAFTQRLGKLPAALRRLHIDCPQYTHSLGRCPVSWSS